MNLHRLSLVDQLIKYLHSQLLVDGTDAIHCQLETCQQTHEFGEHYLLVVKDNQHELTRYCKSNIKRLLPRRPKGNDTRNWIRLRLSTNGMADEQIGGSFVPCVYQ